MIKKTLPCARKLVELSSRGEDDECDLRVTEDRQLEGLLEESVPPLGERHLPACIVLYPPHLGLPSHHCVKKLMIPAPNAKISNTGNNPADSARTVSDPEVRI